MALKNKSIALILAAGWLACTPAWAASVSVVGLFKDMAIVSIDGGKPRTLKVGQTMQGVKLVAAEIIRGMNAKAINPNTAGAMNKAQAKGSRFG